MVSPRAGFMQMTTSSTYSIDKVTLHCVVEALIKLSMMIEVYTAMVVVSGLQGHSIQEALCPYTAARAENCLC
jgi:hypothetical protein